MKRHYFEKTHFEDLYIYSLKQGALLMNYIIGFVILILAFIIASYFFKKKRFKDLDKMEEWKIRLMNSPVTDELSKVKQLNMTGETEEMFENWRNEWDEIVTVLLPEIEEMLFDAEEHIDKYRFSQSKKVQKEIMTKLEAIETDIKRIIDELNDLVGSEEKNRLEVEELQKQYRAVKKQLLAHRHYYGKASDTLETMIEGMVELFSAYEEATTNGNYLHARELVLKMSVTIKDLEYRMKRIPDLFIECNNSIADQLSEIKEGYEEMLEQGYILQHINFPEVAEEIETQLNTYKECLNQADIEEVERGLIEIKDSINVLYDTFEKEVDSRQFIQSNQEKTKEQIATSQYENDKLKMEIATIKKSYHISENDITLQKMLEKRLILLQKQYEQLLVRLNANEFAYSIHADQLKEMISMIQTVNEEQDTLSQKIRDLRKDELEARGHIKTLRQQLIQANKWLKRHNLPGLPEHYQEYLRGAQESLTHVHVKLDETPLDMAAVKLFLEEATIAVETFLKMTKELIEQMLLAEKVIQYTNRYRGRYPNVQQALQEAEEKFRMFEYDAALEEAATVLEKLEPGALKQIEIQPNFEDDE